MYTPGLVPACTLSRAETPSDGLELMAWLHLGWTERPPRPNTSTASPLLSSPPCLAAPSRPGQMAMARGVAAG